MGEECGEECETSIENRKRFDRNNFYSPMKLLWYKESYNPVSFGRTKREREREGKMKNLLASGTSFLKAGERKGGEEIARDGSSRFFFGKHFFNRYRWLVHQH